MARYVSMNNMEALVEAQRDKFDKIDNEFANVYKEFESNKDNMKALVDKQRDKFNEIDNKFANVYKEFESNKTKVSDVLVTHQADIMVLKDKVNNLQRSYLISITIIVVLTVMAFVLGLVIGYKNGRENTENKNLDTTTVAAVDTSFGQSADNYTGEAIE